MALSRDKAEILRLSAEGNVITKPQDIIKQPTVLEFLGIEEKGKYVESDLETAIIDKLQKFLLEREKGYLFEARQKRFTFNEDNFYVDLGKILGFLGKTSDVRMAQYESEARVPKIEMDTDLK